MSGQSLICIVGYAPDSSSDPWHEAEGHKAVIPSPFGCAERCRGISPRVFEGGWPADPASAPSPDLREERSLDFADAPLGMTLSSAWVTVQARVLRSSLTVA